MMLIENDRETMKGTLKTSSQVTSLCIPKEMYARRSNHMAK